MEEEITMFKKNDTIVFFGDSITEAGKVKIESTLVSDSLGRGYVNMVNSHYLLNHPELNLRFINQGISGNRSIDLVNRVDEDVLDFNPDYTFIMVGINDVKRNFDAPQIPYMTTSLKQYQEKL